jgi:hypothetical protein
MRRVFLAPFVITGLLLLPSCSSASEQKVEGTPSSSPNDATACKNWREVLLETAKSSVDTESAATALILELRIAAEKAEPDLYKDLNALNDLLQYQLDEFGTLELTEEMVQIRDKIQQRCKLLGVQFLE